MRRLKLGRIQLAILESLNEMAEMSVAFLTSSRNTKILWKNFHAAQRKNLRYQVQRSLKDLQKKGLVEVIIKSGEPYIKPVKSKKRSQFAIGMLSLVRKPKWDGVWRMVIFDIPERQGRARRALSFQIAKLGVVRLQDSVFVYPFPWNEEVEELTKLFHVGPYIRYIEATSLQGDEKLRNHFDL